MTDDRSYLALAAMFSLAGFVAGVVLTVMVATFPCWGQWMMTPF